MRILIACLLLLPFSVFAGSVGTTKTFASGDTLTATDLNGNVTALTSAINDNDGRITGIRPALGFYANGQLIGWAGPDATGLGTSLINAQGYLFTLDHFSNFPNFTYRTVYESTDCTGPGYSTKLISSGSSNGEVGTDISGNRLYIPSNAVPTTTLSSAINSTGSSTNCTPGLPSGTIPQATPADSQVTINWLDVSGPTANGVSYTVYWNTTGNVTTGDNVISAGSNLQITHNSLTNGTTYYYIVVASNIVGTGPLSFEVSATPTVPVSAPTTPFISVSSHADSQLTLSWQGVSGVDSYTMYWNTTGNVTTGDNVISTGSNLQITHNNLTNGTTYYYRLAASNAIGTSPLSPEISATPAVPIAVYSPRPLYLLLTNDPNVTGVQNSYTPPFRWGIQ